MYTRRPQFTSRDNSHVKTYDINRLIEESTEPRIWKDHIVKDLLKFWDTEAATQTTKGLFSTYRSNKGATY